MTESWGRYPHAQHAAEFPLSWRSEASIPALRPVLPHGQGRSYGDCCLNDGGALLRTGGLDRFISLDGPILRCEAGVTLGQILALAVPRGLFLPVVPGTQHVSVGGAIANDIHGKNHHRAGSFGRHVKRFELLRSDGSRTICAPGDDLFAATVGGLGLTGLVTWAEIALREVPGLAVRMEALKFAGLDQFFALSDESDARSEYTVAWIDVVHRRGVFLRGDHDAAPVRRPRARAAVPLDLPLVNGFTIRAFNAAYYAAQRAGSRLVHYDPFFFPLDAVDRWNRLYGRRGFLQFQCVVPSREGLGAVLQEAPNSAITVLKKFGDVPSPGMLSFPRPGFTLAIDIANDGEAAFARYARMEQAAMEAGGALYPAKDARMSPMSFSKSYPRVAEFTRFVDPAFSSSFWRRVAK